MEGANPYSGMFAEGGEETGGSEQDMRQSLLTAVDKNPDEEARLQALAGRYGMPVDAVRLDRETVTRRAALDSVPYREIVNSLPATGRLLSDPQQAALAHDDVDNLTALEKLFQFQANNRKALAAGYFGFGEGMAGVLQAGAEQLQGLLEPTAGTLLPVNVAQPLADWLGKIRQNQAAWRQKLTAQDTDYLTAATDGLRPVESGFYTGLQSLSQNLLTLPLAVATDNPELALRSMAAGSGGQSYGRARDAGLGANESALYGGADAAIEYGTEQLGVGALFNSLKAGSPLLKSATGFLAREMPGEQVATALQDMNEWLVLHPEKSLSDYLAERPDAALQTAVATLVGGGGQVGLLHTLQEMVGGDSRKAQSAEAAVNWLDELNTLAQSSKLPGRSPDTLQSFVEDVLHHNPDAPQQLYIDAAALQDSGMAQDVVAAVPEVAAQMETALHTGGEVSVPLADYVSKIAANPALALPLREHLRLDGESYSKAEAAEMMVRQAGNEQQKTEATIQPQQHDAEQQEVKEPVGVHRLYGEDNPDKLGADTPVYSKAAVVNGKPGGMSVGHVQLIANGFMRNYNGNIPLQIRVVAHEDDIYGEGSQEAGVRIKGAYHSKTGLIVLIASNLCDVRDAQDTLRHEALGHFGLNTFKPKDKKAILDKIIASRQLPELGEAWAVVEKNYPQAPELLKAEEVFAYLAESPEADVLDRFVKLMEAVLNRALRAIGFINAPITLAELKPLVNSIAQGIRAGTVKQQNFPKSDHVLFSLNEQDKTASDRAVTPIQHPQRLPPDKWLSESVFSEVVEKLVSQFKHHPPVFIHDSIRDVIPEDAGIDGIDGVTNGMVYGGGIHLFREGAHDAGAVAATLWHELLHYGLRRFLSKEEYISQLGDLYSRDEWLRKQADVWINSADGRALQGKETADYIQARGMDEALAELAESGLQGEFAHDSLRSRAIRVVADWVADMAERFGFKEAAAHWRGVSNADARKLIWQVFARLKTDAKPTSIDWAFSSDPAFSKSQQPLEDDLTETAEDNAWQESLAQVRQTVQQQLDALGKHDNRTNSQYAELMTAYFGTMAERLGVLPHELYEATGLNFKGNQRWPGFSQPDKTGPFGPILTDYYHDTSAAIEKLKALQNGEAIAALHHPEIGDIDLVWGKEGAGSRDGYGLSKLIRYHPEVVDDLQAIVSGMQVVSRSKNRAQLESDVHRAGVRLTWDGIAKHWLLTAYEKDKSDATTRTDIDGLTGGDDTARSTIAANIVDQELKKFYQNDRGQYFPYSRTIELLEDADLSTFLHESAHFFLDMQFELAAGILAQQRQAEAALQQPGRKKRGRPPKETQASAATHFSDTAIKKMHDNRVLPGKYATTTRLEMERLREIGTERITSPVEAAQAMAYLSKNAMERCEALLTDSEGRPLAVVAAFKGSLREVPIFPHTLLTEAYRVKGATSIWIAHNHPGAAHQFSPQDEQGNAFLMQLFKGSKLKLRGFVVYGRTYHGDDKWTFEPGPDPLENGAFAFAHHVLEPGQTVTVPVLGRVYDNHDVLGEAFHYPPSLEQVRELTDGKSGLLFTNGLNLPTAFVELKQKDIGTLRNNGRMDRLYRTLSMSNGAMIYVINYGDLSRSAVYNLIGFFHNMQMPVKDLLEIEDEKLSSRKLNKFSLEHYVGFKQQPSPLQAAEDGVLAIRQTGHGLALERTPTPSAAERQPLDTAMARVLADRQTGLMLLDRLRSPRAFVPVSADTSAHGFQQALQLTAAEAAALVNAEDMPVAEREQLQAFLQGLGLSMTELAAEKPSQSEEGVDAAAPNTTGHEQLVADTRMLLDWFGLDSVEDWFKLDLEGQGCYHEQFATGFERYLFEGRAPSQALQGLFERFRQWLIQVYRSLRGLNVQLSPEARQVMDRMLASEAEIRHAQQARAMRRLFVSARQSGMSDQQFAAYRAMDSRATTAATGGLQHKVLADMQWLGNARNQTLKNLQARGHDKRQGLQKQVQAAVDAMPVYKLKAYRDAQPEPVHADVLAEMFHFGSGDEVQRRLAAAEPPDKLVERWTNAKMLQHYAELSSLPALRRAADAEVHNRFRGLCLAQEAEALAKAAGEMRVYADVVETWLTERLEHLPLQQVRPALYVRAETRAARQAQQAFHAGELRQAAVAKRKQLIGFHATRLAYRLQDELDAGLESLDQFESAARQLPKAYRQQIWGLLQRFGDGQPSTQPQPLAAWLKQQQAAGFKPEIAEFLLEPGMHKPCSQLNSRQLRALLAALQQIVHLGELHQQPVQDAERSEAHV